MRKWPTRCAAATALILIVALVVVLQPDAPMFPVGTPLPPGKVTPQLVMGFHTAILLAPDGSLWQWGERMFHPVSVLRQQGMWQVPRRIGSDLDWVQVDMTEDHALALKKDGSLWAWGNNDKGQVGQPNLAHQFNIPTRIGTETNWIKIAAGIKFSFALKDDGSLWSWGDNFLGQLGNGTTTNTSIPTMIGADKDWRAMAAGFAYSGAIKSNGTIWGWGIFARPTLTPKEMNSSLYSGISPPAARELSPGPKGEWTERYGGKSPFFERTTNGNWWAYGENDQGEIIIHTNLNGRSSQQRLPVEFEPRAIASAEFDLSGHGTLVWLAKDGKLWTWGARLGVEKPNLVRQKFESLITPLVKRFPALRFLFRSDIDYRPRLLWELPPEVRRSLGTGPKSATKTEAGAEE